MSQFIELHRRTGTRMDGSPVLAMEVVNFDHVVRFHPSETGTLLMCVRLDGVADTFRVTESTQEILSFLGL